MLWVLIRRASPRLLQSTLIYSVWNYGRCDFHSTSTIAFDTITYIMLWKKWLIVIVWQVHWGIFAYVQTSRISLLWRTIGSERMDLRKQETHQLNESSRLHFIAPVYDYRNNPKYWDRHVWANSVDPERGVGSGSILFATNPASF